MRMVVAALPSITFNTAGLEPGAYKVEVREERVGDAPAAFETLIDLNVTLT
jgi:hypothetical protein